MLALDVRKQLVHLTDALQYVSRRWCSYAPLVGASALVLAWESAYVIALDTAPPLPLRYIAPGAQGLSMIWDSSYIQACRG